MPFPDDRCPTGVGPLFIDDVFYFSFFPDSHVATLLCPLRRSLPRSAPDLDLSAHFSPLVTSWIPDLWEQAQDLATSTLENTGFTQLDEERIPHCAYGFRLDYWRPRCNPFFHTNSLIWRLVDSSSTNPCSADVMVFLPSRDNYPFGHPSAFSLIATKLSERCYSPSALQNTRLTTTRHAIQQNC